ncbi:serine/threonine-protein phosphatase 2A 55 kDa regulatory subunit B delta isoform 1-T1 [Dama dama]
MGATAPTFLCFHEVHEYLRSKLCSLYNDDCIFDNSKCYWNGSDRFKVGQKAAVTTRNIYSAFGPGTADEHTAQWGFKKICTGDESRGDEGVVAGHQKLTASN